MYKVTKRFGSGAEIQVGLFNQEREAKTFIQQKLEDDHRLQMLNTTYSMYEGVDKIRDFAQNDRDISSAEEEASSQKKGSGQSFQPTPFQMGPRPAGIPRSGFKEDEEQDKEK